MPAEMNACVGGSVRKLKDSENHEVEDHIQWNQEALSLSSAFLLKITKVEPVAS